MIASWVWLYADDLALERVKDGDDVLLGVLVYAVLVQRPNDVICDCQVLLFTDVHAFVRGEHVLARVGDGAACASAKKLACHLLEMVQILDVLEAGFHEGVGQVRGNNIIHEAGHAFSPAESFEKCRSHGKLLLMLRVFVDFTGIKRIRDGATRNRIAHRR